MVFINKATIDGGASTSVQQLAASASQTAVTPAPVNYNQPATIQSPAPVNQANWNSNIPVATAPVNYNQPATVTPAAPVIANLSTNDKIAQTISDYAAAHPAPAGTHYGKTLGPDGNPILYRDITAASLGLGGNGGSPTTATITPTVTVNPADTSAINSISEILTQAGLSTLANEAYTKLKAGIPATQIMNDIRNSQQYAQRFPGMAALVARGDRISEADYIVKEKQDLELLKQYNIPSGIFDTTDYLGKLIGNNVTSVDLEKRLMSAQNSVMSLDSNITQYAKDTYGLDAGHLMAWALDPNMSLQVIQQQAQAMQIGGAAIRAGFGGGLGTGGELSKTQAENLANAGVSQTAAQAGFTNIGQQTQLAQALPGDTSGNVTNDQLINAQFGLNAQDTLAVRKVQQRRVNEFQAGGAAVSSNAGVTGLGSANAAS